MNYSNDENVHCEFVRNEMYSVVCGCYSSSRVCYSCCKEMALNNHRSGSILSEKDQLKWIWENCSVVFYPNDGSYPVEHNKKAGKNNKNLIESYMQNDETSSS